MVRSPTATTRIAPMRSARACWPAACAARDVLLVHLSTDYVFDGSARSPVDEWQEPTSALRVRSQQARRRERGACDRAQIPGGAHLLAVRTPGPNFVLTMLRAAEQGKPLRVVADQVGTPTWTGHLAPALLRLIARDIPGTFHLTNSGQVSWHGFAQAIVDAGGTATTVTAITTADWPTAAPRPAYSVLDNQVWRMLGESPLPDWREGLRRLPCVASRAATAGG